MPGEAWLGTLLDPLPAAIFLSQIWARQPHLCRGPADRFLRLLTWPVLDELLAHHWRETYRFRLALQGRDLDPASYADVDAHPPRVRPKDLVDQLRSGATLSFNGVDELHEPLTELAQAFEDVFRGSTQINVYAGWRASHGLDLHRDDQDVFVLHLDGRKRWLLYGFAIDGIDRQELARTSTPPAGATVDEILTAGDLLYVPRGCYHLAIPMNEPTLHLTVGVKTPRAETDGTAKFRPSFSLPWSATPDRLPPGRDFSIRLLVDFHKVADDDATAPSVVLAARGHTYRFPRAMLAIVELLSDRQPRSFVRVIERSGRDEQTARLLTAMLIKEGLIAVGSW